MYLPRLVSLKEENASQSQCLPVVMLRGAVRRDTIRAGAPLPFAVGA